MSLQPYQLCRWCDAMMQGWKKSAFLGENVLLLLLAVLVRPLRVALLALMLLIDAVTGLYLLYRRRAFGAEYQRVPRPQDAQGETVLIDAQLIGEGTRLRAAAQPFDAAEALSLRLGSGALLLGTAMTLTADELPPAERAAVLSAVQQLNIKPDRMRSYSPVLRREQVGHVTCVTVRDGAMERSYYMGAPEDVKALAPRIWDGQAREMTEGDSMRITDTARYIAQGNCHVLAWATALADESPVFLGLAGLGASIYLQAAQEVSALRAQGLTVMIDAENPDDAQALRVLLELPEHHARAEIHLTEKGQIGGNALAVTRAPGDSLLAPVMNLRQRFFALERMLRRFAVLLAWPLLLCVLFGCWPAAVVSAGMLVYAALSLGVDGADAQPRSMVWVGLSVAAVVAKLLLTTQTAAVAQLCGGSLAVLTAAGCALRLCGQTLHLKGQGSLQCLALAGTGVVYVLAAMLVCGASAGAMLVPLAFTLAVASVMNILLLCEHRIFR